MKCTNFIKHHARTYAQKRNREETHESQIQ